MADSAVLHTSPAAADRAPGFAPDRFALLRAIERKVLWLSTWTIHHANHVRPNVDGLKVGGHQASSASVATLMTALYFAVLRPHDRVAVKPHASPAFHAIEYLFGRQSRANLEGFRAMGGAQSYPSRTKDTEDVDFSTGSVGLGVAMTAFASLVQDYLDAKQWLPPGSERGRMVALVGDAELDEGNVFEALLEAWKHRLRNLWWVIDYNRQSLDAVISDRLFGRFEQLFTNMGWRVVTIKYGKRLRRAFEQPGGDALRQWIDDCSNDLYSALVFKGGAAWRNHLLRDIGTVSGVRALLDEHDDDHLHALMTNLGGHDMESVVEAFESVEDDLPTCFIAYTIKGYRLPFAGHKDNHAGLMNPEQMAVFKQQMGVSDGDEWEPLAGLDVDADTMRAFLAEVPFTRGGERRRKAAPVAVPAQLPSPAGARLSTQEGFGRLLAAIARDRGELGARVVTTSPDVTVSTNLGGWVNRKGIFDRQGHHDSFAAEEVASMQRWETSPQGQHIELGIAENNLFLLLGALGLSHSLFGVRLLPVGTVYDPFIERGLDALNYACYQDARFLLVATPSGISLAPEGGAHQSITTPMIGMAKPGLSAFEPAFVDELAVIMRWAFEHMQRHEAITDSDDGLDDAAGGSSYLRLSTRAIDQPERAMTDELAEAIIKGGYWIRKPEPETRIVIVYAGAVAPEALRAHAVVAEDFPDAAVLAVTSADRLYRGWQRLLRGNGHAPRRTSHVQGLLAEVAADARLVTVIDAHPATLSWIGAVCGQRVYPLGVDGFGQSGNLVDLYRHHGIDADAIVAACAAACLET